MNLQTAQMITEIKNYSSPVQGVLPKKMDTHENRASLKFNNNILYFPLYNSTFKKIGYQSLNFNNESKIIGNIDSGFFYKKKGKKLKNKLFITESIKKTLKYELKEDQAIICTFGKTDSEINKWIDKNIKRAEPILEYLDSKSKDNYINYQKRLSKKPIEDIKQVKALPVKLIQSKELNKPIEIIQRDTMLKGTATIGASHLKYIATKLTDSIFQKGFRYKEHKINQLCLILLSIKTNKKTHLYSRRKENLTPLIRDDQEGRYSGHKWSNQLSGQIIDWMSDKKNTPTINSLLGANIPIDKPSMNSTIGYRLKERYWEKGKLSTFTPHIKLVKALEKIEFPVILKEEEIVLQRIDTNKGKKNKTKKYCQIGYRETPETNKMRSDIQAYTRILNKVSITFVKNTKDKEGNPTTTLIRLGEIKQKRCFGRNFNEGGRISGCKIQRLNSDERNTTNINGEPVIESDYCNCQLSILYALAKIPVHKDLYDISEQKCMIKNTKANRKFIKKCSLMLPNVASKTGFITAVKKDLESKQKPLPSNIDNPTIGFTIADPKEFQPKQLSLPLDIERAGLKNVINDVIALHKPLFDKGILWDKNAGKQAQNIESNITMDIINHFTRQGTPVLNIHDSNIIQAKYETELVDVMAKAFKRQTGATNVRMEIETCNGDKRKIYA